MVHETIQTTFRQTNLTNESAGYLAKCECIGTPRVVPNKSQPKQVAEVALRSAKLIQSVMS